MVGDGGDPFQTPGSWEAGSPGAGMTGVTCITQLPGGDPWAAIAGHLGLKDSVAEKRNRLTYQYRSSKRYIKISAFLEELVFFPANVVHSFFGFRFTCWGIWTSNDVAAQRIE